MGRKIIVYGVTAEQIPEGIAKITETVEEDGGNTSRVEREVNVKRDGPNGIIISGPKVKLSNDWSIVFNPSQCII